MNEPLTRKEAVALAIPFSIALGVLYSFGYWGHFEINALQYVSLIDVAKLAVYPLLFLAFSTAISILYTEVGIAHILPPGGGADTRIGRFGRKHWRLFALILLGAVVAVAISVSDPWRWYIVGVLCTNFSVLLTHLSAFVELVPHPRMRAAIATQLLLLPFFALAIGKHSAISAESGGSALFLDSDRTNLSIKADPTHPVAYLGRLGDSVAFFETKSRRIVIAKLKDDVPLVLRRREAQSTPPSN